MSKPIDQEREALPELKSWPAFADALGLKFGMNDTLWDNALSLYQKITSARAAVQPAGVAVPEAEWVMHLLADRWPESAERVEVELFAEWLREVLAAAPHPVSGEQKPTAYLHQVIQGDGEPDLALSFEPDSFPLSEALGFRSLACEPLYKSQTAAQDVAGLMREHRISVTPEYDGQWHAELYGHEAEPLARAEGDTPESAVHAVIAAHRAQQGEQS